MAAMMAASWAEKKIVKREKYLAGLMNGLLVVDLVRCWAY